MQSGSAHLPRCKRRRKQYISHPALRSMLLPTVLTPAVAASGQSVAAMLAARCAVVRCADCVACRVVRAPSAVRAVRRWLAGLLYFTRDLVVACLCGCVVGPKPMQGLPTSLLVARG
jgi:hypothetical protein